MADILCFCLVSREDIWGTWSVEGLLERLGAFAGGDWIGLDSSLLKSGRARAGFDRDGRARGNPSRSSVEGNERRWIARDGDLEVRRADGSAPTAARAASMISLRPDPRQKTTTVNPLRAIGRPPRAAETRGRGVGDDRSSKA